MKGISELLGVAEGLFETPTDGLADGDWLLEGDAAAGELLGDGPVLELELVLGLGLALGIRVWLDRLTQDAPLLA